MVGRAGRQKMGNNQFSGVKHIQVTLEKVIGMRSEGGFLRIFGTFASTIKIYLLVFRRNPVGRPELSQC